MNSVQLTGNLGTAPEIRVFDNGSKLARFSMATNDRYTNKKGEPATETYWHSIIAWGRLADMAERLLDKGKEVKVSGKIVNKSYVDKNGIKRWSSEVEARDIELTSRAA